MEIITATSPRPVKLLAYAEKYNLKVRNGLLWAIRDRSASDWEATIDELLQMDPFELAKCRQVGPKSMNELAKTISAEYSLPDSWNKFLDDTQNCGEKRKRGLTDIIRRGEYIFIAVKTAANEISLSKIKVKEVFNSPEDPKDRYIILESPVSLDGKSLDVLTDKDLLEYSDEARNTRIFRSMKEVRSNLTSWMNM